MSRMRPLVAFLLYLAVVLLGGPLLAPWLYWLAQHLGDTWPWLADQPFRRYVNRCMLVVALSGMYPLIRAFGARSAAELGLVRPAGQWGRLLGGFALGFASLAVIVVVCMIVGVRVWGYDLDGPGFAKILVEAALAGVAVSIIEELLFRGAIYGAFRKVMNWPLAALISSAIYAILHFMKRVDDMPADHWYSGLIVLGHMFSGFANWHELIPGFFNLTLAGMLLALAYQRSGNLYFSIGLHGGWIFWRRAYGAVTDQPRVDGLEVPPSAYEWFFGTKTMVDGWLAAIVLIGALIVLWKLPLHRPGWRHAVEASEGKH
ncbi:MAG: CPBP family intramembrane metalloprotease [Verrucomicrobia bacterium]|nr:CPBP family intramembrane metalloprotease [Verrucomicrobiota bacterium]